MAARKGYDAFISYRHLPLDRVVAVRLQMLLERYRPPRGVEGVEKGRRLRLFRDKTELPTSGNLGDSLQSALLSSDFLITILSEKTVDSKWCMAEIREFKEAHGGSISHILPVIVSGDPSDVIPKELRTASRTIELANGLTSVEEYEVEPLCADVRSKGKLGALIQLQTEFLRIAAPLLGCGYDDLYQRHLRHQRRVLAAAVIGLLAVTITFATMAFVIYHTEKNYENNLVNTYTQQGSAQILLGNDQEAMTYFGAALSIDANSSAARSGALLMLQGNRWPYLANQREGSLGKGDADKYYEASIDEDSITFYDKNGQLVSIDLVGVFPERAQLGDLDTYGEVWTSADGSLVAVNCGASVAIIRLSDQTVLMGYQNYAYTLNDVVFSHDGQNVAFVYGNYLGLDYQDPGGFVRVCKLGDNDVFETEPDSQHALRGAVFSSDDHVLVAWGSGILQFFDFDMRNAYAEDLHCPSVDAVAFDGNTIVVDQGDGHVCDCCFTSFTPLHDGAGTGNAELPAGQDVWDSKLADQSVQELRSGLSIKMAANAIQLINDKQTVLSEASLGNKSVNQMYVGRDQDYALVWQHATSKLWRIGIDVKNKRLETAAVVPVEGREIVGVCGAGDGFIVVAGNGQLLYYETLESTASKLLNLGMNGQVKEIVVNSQGLAALIVHATKFVDPLRYFNFDSYYGVEVWDLHKGVRFAEFEKNNQMMLTELSFGADGYLGYDKSGERIQWWVDAPTPDKQAVEALQSLPCFVLEESQILDVRNSYSGDLNLGNWENVIGVHQAEEIESNDVQPGPEEELIERADELLDTEDFDAWLSYYHDLWERIEDGSVQLSFTQETALFSNYVQSAMRFPELTERVEQGIAVYAQDALSQAKSNMLESIGIDTQMTQMLVLTHAYDSLMADYWNSLAEQTMDAYAQDGKTDLMSYALAYECRMLAATVEGKGPDAFLEAERLVGTKHLKELYDYTSMGVLRSLAEGKLNKAGTEASAYIASYMDLDPRLSFSDVYDDIALMMMEANLIAARNNVDEKDLDCFVDATGYRIGCELTSLSSQNRAHGLRLGDKVFTVDGHLFCSPAQLRLYQRTHPKAKLTYLRDGSERTTDAIKDWKIAGNFFIDEKE